jgi:diguanylate cyclase (GGDEF)-like protein/PAS domain S-box-containing protein
MAPRLDDFAIDHIEQARARAAARAERRELATELAVAVCFVVAAVALVLGASSIDWTLTAWLSALLGVLVLIEFEVGEGNTGPIHLALVPMLVLLDPAVVPVAVLAAHLPRDIISVLRGRRRPSYLLLPVADCAFILPPSLVFLAVDPSGLWATALTCLAALAALFVSDLTISAVRMKVGLGLDPRGELRGFAWMYVIDLCLAPVGFLAALAGVAHPVLVALVLPLAGLLVIFARERRGRIDNALELQRVERDGRETLQTIVSNSSDCILIVGLDGTLRVITGSAEPIFGSEDAEGSPLLARVHEQDEAPVRAFLRSVATKRLGEPHEAEWRMRYADGSYRHVAAAANSLLDDPRVRGIVLTVRDVEARKAFEEQLRHRAFHDPLTGLANRALFYDRIEHSLNRGTRTPAQAGVLFVDLDDFKTINDTRGHTDGDVVLVEVARRLATSLRSGDTAARLGGDEFGILLEHLAGPPALQTAAQRILEALAQPIETENGPVNVSASVGMAISTPLDRGADQFLRKADLAMYEAKRGGKGRAEFYEAHLEGRDVQPGLRGQWFARDDEQRAEIEAVLADPEGIAIVFQPIMDMRTGRIAGYESLSRFEREPRRGPDVWFAQAHRYGLGYALEAKAIACALSTPHRPTDAYLTFNVSPSSLLSEEVREVLPERLDGLVIEITENELVSGDEAILDALAELRMRGARLAVDDTGAGYAGLTHVMRLQPDIIKLDRALTTGVDHDPAKAPLVASFVRYARDIDADVCAEGVETLAELERLADLDVAYGQGYGIARPAPPWAAVSEESSAACLRSFQATLSDGGDATDRLVRRLASVTSVDELQECLPALAAELRASSATIAAPERYGDAAQVLTGEGSRLNVPITYGGVLVGHLVAFSDAPWSRHQIARARLLCYQLSAPVGVHALN